MWLLKDMYRTYCEKDTGYEMKVQSQFYMIVYLLVTPLPAAGCEPGGHPEAIVT